MEQLAPIGAVFAGGEEGDAVEAGREQIGAAVAVEVVDGEAVHDAGVFFIQDAALERGAAIGGEGDGGPIFGRGGRGVGEGGVDEAVAGNLEAV